MSAMFLTQKMVSFNKLQSSRTNKDELIKNNNPNPQSKLRILVQKLADQSVFGLPALIRIILISFTSTIVYPIYPISLPQPGESVRMYCD